MEKKILMMVGLVSGSVFAMQVNKVDKELYDAAMAGKVEAVKVALVNEANPNAKFGGGRTALHQAARYGYSAIVKELLDAKADVNSKDEDGETPLQLAVVNLRDSKSHENIALELMKAGAEVNVVERDGRTPLMYVVRFGSPELVRAFIDKKADVNAADKDRATVLSRAKTRGDQRIIEILKKAGAR